ncbi:hypothetical protein BN1221_01079 [Brenneria goodwinii]|uniref:Uncharacterized protein n=1 Tax=Brenneria goodwinii TaxID=1109412 RepID=A0A0G4JRW1_9GAMM|nr:hypothetical protein BN1221_01079 [Brenneria goodwinii]
MIAGRDGLLEATPDEETSGVLTDSVRKRATDISVAQYKL